jgi:dUTP pyrophosphatase
MNMATMLEGSDQASWPPGVLSRELLRGSILDQDRPLITDWLDLERQLQPNGFDLTLREVNTLASAGQIGVSSDDRSLPELSPVPTDERDWFTLAPGAYHILYNEVVDLPPNLMALGRPRSSLGRCGVTIHTAVWDAGYRGRSTSLLSILNPNGFRLQRNARVMQLVFFRLAVDTMSGYEGRYQGENLPDPHCG